MSQADFDPVLVEDDLLDVRSKLEFAVEDGPGANTYQVFNAISANTNSIVFNVSVPSEGVAVNREVLIRSKIRFTIKSAPTANTAPFFGTIGIGAALQAFPLASLMNNISAQINNVNVSSNLQDILYPLTKMNSITSLQQYQSTTPSLPDGAYRFYSQGAAEINTNNPLNGYFRSSLANDISPRGGHKMVLVGNITYSGGRAAEDGTDAAHYLATADNQTATMTYEIDVTEPLFLSPFFYADSSNRGAFYGLNALNININLDSTAKRLMSVSKTDHATQPTITLVSLTETQLYMQFLTPNKPMPERNVLPYHDINRYLTTGPEILHNASKSVSSNSIQLNQVPDYIIVFVRKPMASLNITDSNFFLPISNLSVNFNNTAGLLSGATPQQLWKMSVRNGSTQSWKEFSGLANQSESGVQSDVYTGGPMVVISAKDLSLPKYLASSSIGQFNLQVSVTAQNTCSNTAGVLQEDLASTELVVMVVNSGVFVTSNGTSSVYTGLLSKNMILDVKEKRQAAITEGEYRKMKGGAMESKGALKDLVKMAAKEYSQMEGEGVRLGGAYSAAGSKLDSLSF